MSKSKKDRRKDEIVFRYDEITEHMQELPLWRLSNINKQLKPECHLRQVIGIATIHGLAIIAITIHGGMSLLNPEKLNIPR